MTAAPDSTVAALMSSQGLTQSQATTLLNHESASALTLNAATSDSGLSPDDFVLDPGTGDLVGYYTTTAQQQALANDGITSHPVSLSAAALKIDADKLAAAVPDGDGFQSVSVDIANQKIVVRGTQTFFSSSDWSSASAGLPVSMVVTNVQLSEQPNDSTAAASTPATLPVPGWRTITSEDAGWVSICTLGWVTQQATVMTAGHCTYDPYEAHPINSLGRTVYNSAYVPFGTTNSSLFQRGGRDLGRIGMYSGYAAAGTGYYANGTSGGKNRIYAVRTPVKGTYVCQYGRVSVESCGTIDSAYTNVSYGGVKIYGVVATSACVRAGDSGGPVAQPISSSSGIALGMVSGGSTSNPCASDSYFSRLVDALHNYNSSMNTATGSSSG